MEGIGFDVISDLHLSPEDSFNWEGKATSLYCIVAGNISSDLRTIHQTLFHLSHFYQGIFYTIGSLEYEGVSDVSLRTEEIIRTCRGIRNVALLMSNVVIIKNIAIMGANGWYGHVKQDDLSDMRQFEDISYLGHSLEKLQLHMDVSRIVMVTGSVPNPTLFFGEEDQSIYLQVPPSICLERDTERKVSHWVFGSYKKIVDATIDGINYVNNPYLSRPYWAKRITV